MEGGCGSARAAFQTSNTLCVSTAHGAHSVSAELVERVPSGAQGLRPSKAEVISVNVGLLFLPLLSVSMTDHLWVMFGHFPSICIKCLNFLVQ